MFKVIVNLIDV